MTALAAAAPLPDAALAIPPAPASRLEPPSVAIGVVSPHAGGAGPLGAFVRESVPFANVEVCNDPEAAGDLAVRARRLGLTIGVWIFDFRGCPVGDLAAMVRKVSQEQPKAELVVIMAANDAVSAGACLQVCRSAAKLTFLMSPAKPEEAGRAIRTVAERYRATDALQTDQDAGEFAVRTLENQVKELRIHLDSATHAARHDGLTGLLNRQGFVHELTVRMATRHVRQCVLIIDLDRFKAVNDTLGHAAGDDLVRKICTAMSEMVPKGAILARLGGDEFGIIVEEYTHEAIEELCLRLLKVCAQSRRVLGHEVQVSASIGVAHLDAGQNEMELIHQADLALYAAKRDGRNRHRTYDAAIDAAVRYRLSIEIGLERSLAANQFKLAYQPIVRADSGAILGFEALCRWTSPDHGAVSPAEFVPVAEETGLILDLGEWITRQALKDCRKWGGPYVSINLSARQFLRHNVAEQILRYAADADLSPTKIQIELTETAIIDDVERANHNLSVLRAAGVRVALDDFGTGYSSLVYLKQFAIDCIKIDKSFIDNLTTDRQSAVIVASVTRLAASLGMSVVAEGVETEPQRQVLMAAGCGALQGYLFGRPMMAQDVAGFIQEAARKLG